jgi:hypothetical protein
VNEKNEEAESICFERKDSIFSFEGKTRKKFYFEKEIFYVFLQKIFEDFIF